MHTCGRSGRIRTYVFSLPKRDDGHFRYTPVMVEDEGFEPSDPLRSRRFSKALRSASLPIFHVLGPFLAPCTANRILEHETGIEPALPALQAVAYPLGNSCVLVQPCTACFRMCAAFACLSRFQKTRFQSRRCFHHCGDGTRAARCLVTCARRTHPRRPVCRGRRGLEWQGIACA